MIYPRGGKYPRRGRIYPRGEDLSKGGGFIQRRGREFIQGGMFNGTFAKEGCIKGVRCILRGAVRRYTEASDTGENISRSGSFPTSVLEIEPRTSAT